VPRLAQAVPAPGDLLVFTNLTITFSEAVSGMDAGDLLINGVPAGTVASTNDLTYVFGFAQPAYGPVVIAWVASADNIYRFRDESVVVEISDLLANDEDLDGDPVLFTGVSPLSARGATVEVAGRYVFYTPPGNIHDLDTFTYTAVDGRGGSATGLVTVALTDNTPPFLAARPDVVVNVLSRLALTNFASDADVPLNKLTLSLEGPGD